jgi:hypothetical protein
LEWQEGLVFGVSAVSPFPPKSLSARADRAWEKANLERICLHECRHTAASLMIAAGVNAKALSEYMGHSNISITYDLYGHLMPGNEGDAAGLLDSYFTRELDTQDLPLSRPVTPRYRPPLPCCTCGPLCPPCC